MNKNWPEEIWLDRDVYLLDYKSVDSEIAINPDLLYYPEINYVRADLYEDLEKKLQIAEDRLKEVDQRCKDTYPCYYTTEDLEDDPVQSLHKRTQNLKERS